MAYKIGDNTVIDDNRALTAVGVTAATNLNIPSGNTAGRPTGAVGKLYFDTDLGKLIVHNGTEWKVAGGSEEDLSEHNKSFMRSINSSQYVSGLNYEYIAPYNEAVSRVLARSVDTTNDKYTHSIKPKNLPHDIVLSHSYVGRNAKHPNNPAIVSLDNKACSYSFGGGISGVTRYIQNVIFDSTYNDSYFRIDSDNNVGNSDWGHEESQGIRKYSDTCYICFNKWHMRAYNPANVTQGTGATKLWGKNYYENGVTAGFQHIMAITKSATANCITVWAGNMNINTNPSGAETLRIYDVDVTDGSINGQAVSYSMLQHEIISLLHHPPQECSTHCVFVNERTASTGGMFYIWNKSTRELKKVTGMEYYGPSYQEYHAGAFKMNDKIYYVNSNKSTTDNSYGALIYEITATGASGYASINVGNSTGGSAFDPEVAGNVDKMIYRNGPQHSTNTYTWHWRDATARNSGQGNSSDHQTNLEYWGKTVNWETSKTSLGDDFNGVTSADFTHSPTVSSALSLTNITLDNISNSTNGVAPADFAGEMYRIKYIDGMID